MKTFSRFLVLASLLMMGCLPGASQLRYGIRAGATFADARINDAAASGFLALLDLLPGADPGDYVYSLDNRSGFSGGLVLEYQMPRCGFAPDIAVLYTRYNTRLQSKADGKSSFGRNFIEVPIHLKYKFWLKSVSELVAPMIYTGPSFMFRLDHDDSHPIATKRVQPGWDVGIGFDIVNFIQITGGYRFGLGNAISRYDGYDAGAAMHTNAWNVSATLLFDF